MSPCRAPPPTRNSMLGMSARASLNDFTVAIEAETSPPTPDRWKLKSVGRSCRCSAAASGGEIRL